jgi:hypothetical protein
MSQEGRSGPDPFVLRKDPEYERLTPPRSREAFEALKESIRRDGQREEIVANSQGIILHGNGRFDACHELGITPRYRIRNFPSALEEKRFVLEANLTDRQLNPYQRVVIGASLIELERERARQRQVELGRTHGVIDPSAPGGADGRGKVTEIVSKRIGLKSRTLERGLFLLAKC